MAWFEAVKKELENPYSSESEVIKTEDNKSAVHSQLPGRIDQKAATLWNLDNIYPNKYTRTVTRRKAIELYRVFVRASRSERKTPNFMDTARTQLTMLHLYNDSVRMQKKKYPRTIWMFHLLCRYVALEFEALGPNPDPNKCDVQNLVLALETILSNYFEDDSEIRCKAFMVHIIVTAYHTYKFPEWYMETLAGLALKGTLIVKQLNEVFSGDDELLCVGDMWLNNELKYLMEMDDFGTDDEFSDTSDQEDSKDFLDSVHRKTRRKESQFGNNKKRSKLPSSSKVVELQDNDEVISAKDEKTTPDCEPSAVITIDDDDDEAGHNGDFKSERVEVIDCDEPPAPPARIARVTNRTLDRRKRRNRPKPICIDDDDDDDKIPGDSKEPTSMAQKTGLINSLEISTTSGDTEEKATATSINRSNETNSDQISSTVVIQRHDGEAIVTSTKRKKNFGIDENDDFLKELRELASSSDIKSGVAMNGNSTALVGKVDNNALTSTSETPPSKPVQPEEISSTDVEIIEVQATINASNSSAIQIKYNTLTSTSSTAPTKSKVLAETLSTVEKHSTTSSQFPEVSSTQNEENTVKNIRTVIPETVDSQVGQSNIEMESIEDCVHFEEDVMPDETIIIGIDGVLTDDSVNALIARHKTSKVDKTLIIKSSTVNQLSTAKPQMELQKFESSHSKIDEIQIPDTNVLKELLDQDIKKLTNCDQDDKKSTEEKMKDDDPLTKSVQEDNFLIPDSKANQETQKSLIPEETLSAEKSLEILGRKVWPVVEPVFGEVQKDEPVGVSKVLQHHGRPINFVRNEEEIVNSLEGCKKYSEDHRNLSNLTVAVNCIEEHQATHDIQAPPSPEGLTLKDIKAQQCAEHQSRENVCKEFADNQLKENFKPQESVEHQLRKNITTSDYTEGISEDIEAQECAEHIFEDEKVQECHQSRKNISEDIEAQECTEHIFKDAKAQECAEHQSRVNISEDIRAQKCTQNIFEDGKAQECTEHIFEDKKTQECAEHQLREKISKDINAQVCTEHIFEDEKTQECAERQSRENISKDIKAQECREHIFEDAKTQECAEHEPRENISEDIEAQECTEHIFEDEKAQECAERQSRENISEDSKAQECTEHIFEDAKTQDCAEHEPRENISADIEAQECTEHIFEDEKAQECAERQSRENISEDSKAQECTEHIFEDAKDQECAEHQSRENISEDIKAQECTQDIFEDGKPQECSEHTFEDEKTQECVEHEDIKTQEDPKHTTKEVKPQESAEHKPRENLEKNKLTQDFINTEESPIKNSSVPQDLPRQTSDFENVGNPEPVQPPKELRHMEGGETKDLKLTEQKMSDFSKIKTSNCEDLQGIHFLSNNETKERSKNFESCSIQTPEESVQSIQSVDGINAEIEDMASKSFTLKISKSAGFEDKETEPVNTIGDEGKEEKSMVVLNEEPKCMVTSLIKIEDAPSEECKNEKSKNHSLQGKEETSMVVINEEPKCMDASLTKIEDAPSEEFKNQKSKNLSLEGKEETSMVVINEEPKCMDASLTKIEDAPSEECKNEKSKPWVEDEETPKLPLKDESESSEKRNKYVMMELSKEECVSSKEHLFTNQLQDLMITEDEVEDKKLKIRKKLEETNEHETIEPSKEKCVSSKEHLFTNQLQDLMITEDEVEDEKSSVHQKLTVEIYGKETSDDLKPESESVQLAESVPTKNEENLENCELETTKSCDFINTEGRQMINSKTLGSGISQALQNEVAGKPKVEQSEVYDVTEESGEIEEDALKNDEEESREIEDALKNKQDLNEQKKPVNSKSDGMNLLSTNNRLLKESEKSAISNHLPESADGDKLDMTKPQHFVNTEERQIDSETHQIAALERVLVEATKNELIRSSDPIEASKKIEDDKLKGFNRQELIEENLSPHSILQKSNNVDPRVINLLCENDQKELTNVSESLSVEVSEKSKVTIQLAESTGILSEENKLVATQPESFIITEDSGTSESAENKIDTTQYENFISTEDSKTSESAGNKLEDFINTEDCKTSEFAENKLITTQPENFINTGDSKTSESAENKLVATQPKNFINTDDSKTSESTENALVTTQPENFNIIEDPKTSESAENNLEDCKTSKFAKNKLNTAQPQEDFKTSESAENKFHTTQPENFINTEDSKTSESAANKLEDFINTEDPKTSEFAENILVVTRPENFINTEDVKTSESAENKLDRTQTENSINTADVETFKSVENKFDTTQNHEVSKTSESAENKLVTTQLENFNIIEDPKTSESAENKLEDFINTEDSKTSESSKSKMDTTRPEDSINTEESKTSESAENNLAEDFISAIDPKTCESGLPQALQHESSHLPDGAESISKSEAIQIEESSRTEDNQLKNSDNQNFTEIEESNEDHKGQKETPNDLEPRTAEQSAKSMISIQLAASAASTNENKLNAAQSQQDFKTCESAENKFDKTQPENFINTEDSKTSVTTQPENLNIIEDPKTSESAENKLEDCKTSKSAKNKLVTTRQENFMVTEESETSESAENKFDTAQPENFINTEDSKTSVTTQPENLNIIEDPKTSESAENKLEDCKTSKSAKNKLVTTRQENFMVTEESETSESAENKFDTAQPENFINTEDSKTSESLVTTKPENFNIIEDPKTSEAAENKLEDCKTSKSAKNKLVTTRPENFIVIEESETSESAENKFDTAQPENFINTEDSKTSESLVTTEPENFNIIEDPKTSEAAETSKSAKKQLNTAQPQEDFKISECAENKFDTTRPENFINTEDPKAREDFIIAEESKKCEGALSQDSQQESSDLTDGFRSIGKPESIQNAAWSNEQSEKIEDVQLKDFNNPELIVISVDSKIENSEGNDNKETSSDLKPRTLEDQKGLPNEKSMIPMQPEGRSKTENSNSEDSQVINLLSKNDQTEILISYDSLKDKSSEVLESVGASSEEKKPQGFVDTTERQIVNLRALQNAPSHQTLGSGSISKPEAEENEENGRKRRIGINTGEVLQMINLLSKNDQKQVSNLNDSLKNESMISSKLLESVDASSEEKKPQGVVDTAERQIVVDLQALQNAPSRQTLSSGSISKPEAEENEENGRKRRIEIDAGEVPEVINLLNKNNREEISNDLEESEKSVQNLKPTEEFEGSAPQTNSYKNVGKPKSDSIKNSSKTEDDKLKDKNRLKIENGAESSTRSRRTDSEKIKSRHSEKADLNTDKKRSRSSKRIVEAVNSSSSKCSAETEKSTSSRSHKSSDGKTRSSHSKERSNVLRREKSRSESPKAKDDAAKRTKNKSVRDIKDRDKKDRGGFENVLKTDEGKLKRDVKIETPPLKQKSSESNLKKNVETGKKHRNKSSKVDAENLDECEKEKHIQKVKPVTGQVTIKALDNVEGGKIKSNALEVSNLDDDRRHEKGEVVSMIAADVRSHKKNRVEDKEAKRGQETITNTLEAPSATDIKLLEASSTKDVKSLEAPSTKGMKSLEAPSTKDIKSLEAPSTKNSKSLEVSSTKDIKSLEVSSTKDIRSLEAPSTKGIKCLEAPTTKDIKSWEAPSTKDIKSLEAPSTKDSKSLEAPSTKDIKSLEVQPLQDGKSLKRKEKSSSVKTSDRSKKEQHARGREAILSDKELHGEEKKKLKSVAEAKCALPDKHKLDLEDRKEKLKDRSLKGKQEARKDRETIGKRLEAQPSSHSKQKRMRSSDKSDEEKQADSSVSKQKQMHSLDKSDDDKSKEKQVDSSVSKQKQTHSLDISSKEKQADSSVSKQKQTHSLDKSSKEKQVDSDKKPKNENGETVIADMEHLRGCETKNDMKPITDEPNIQLIDDLKNEEEKIKSDASEKIRTHKSNADLDGEKEEQEATLKIAKEVPSRRRKQETSKSDSVQKEIQPNAKKYDNKSSSTSTVAVRIIEKTNAKITNDNKSSNPDVTITSDEGKKNDAEKSKPVTSKKGLRQNEIDSGLDGRKDKGEAKKPIEEVKSHKRKSFEGKDPERTSKRLHLQSLSSKQRETQQEKRSKAKRAKTEKHEDGNKSSSGDERTNKEKHSVARKKRNDDDGLGVAEAFKDLQESEEKKSKAQQAETEKYEDGNKSSKTESADNETNPVTRKKQNNENHDESSGIAEAIIFETNKEKHAAARRKQNNANDGRSSIGLGVAEAFRFNKELQECENKKGMVVEQLKYDGLINSKSELDDKKDKDEVRLASSGKRIEDKDVASERVQNLKSEKEVKSKLQARNKKKKDKSLNALDKSKTEEVQELLENSIVASGRNGLNNGQNSKKLRVNEDAVVAGNRNDDEEAETIENKVGYGKETSKTSNIQKCVTLILKEKDSLTPNLTESIARCADVFEINRPDKFEEFKYTLKDVSKTNEGYVNAAECTTINYEELASTIPKIANLEHLSGSNATRKINQSTIPKTVEDLERLQSNTAKIGKHSAPIEDQQFTVKVDEMDGYVLETCAQSEYFTKQDYTRKVSESIVEGAFTNIVEGRVANFTEGTFINVVDAPANIIKLASVNPSTLSTRFDFATTGSTENVVETTKVNAVGMENDRSKSVETKVNPVGNEEKMLEIINRQNNSITEVIVIDQQNDSISTETIKEGKRVPEINDIALQNNAEVSFRNLQARNQAVKSSKKARAGKTLEHTVEHLQILNETNQAIQDIINTKEPSRKSRLEQASSVKRQPSADATRCNVVESDTKAVKGKNKPPKRIQVRDRPKTFEEIMNSLRDSDRISDPGKPSKIRLVENFTGEEDNSGDPAQFKDEYKPSNGEEMVKMIQDFNAKQPNVIVEHIPQFYQAPYQQLQSANNPVATATEKITRPVAKINIFENQDAVSDNNEMDLNVSKESDTRPVDVDERPLSEKLKDLGSWVTNPISETQSAVGDPLFFSVSINKEDNKPEEQISSLDNNLPPVENASLSGSPVDIVTDYQYPDQDTHLSFFIENQLTEDVYLIDPNTSENMFIPNICKEETIEHDEEPVNDFSSDDQIRKQFNQPPVLSLETICIFDSPAVNTTAQSQINLAVNSNPGLEFGVQGAAQEPLFPLTNISLADMDTVNYNQKGPFTPAQLTNPSSSEAVSSRAQQQFDENVLRTPRIVPAALENAFIPELNHPAETESTHKAQIQEVTTPTKVTNKKHGKSPVGKVNLVDIKKLKPENDENDENKWYVRSSVRTKVCAPKRKSPESQKPEAGVADLKQNVRKRLLAPTISEVEKKENVKRLKSSNDHDEHCEAKPKEPAQPSEQLSNLFERVKEMDPNTLPSLNSVPSPENSRDVSARSSGNKRKPYALVKVEKNENVKRLKIFNDDDEDFEAEPKGPIQTPEQLSNLFDSVKKMDPNTLPLLNSVTAPGNSREMPVNSSSNAKKPHPSVNEAQRKKSKRNVIDAEKADGKETKKKPRHKEYSIVPEQDVRWHTRSAGNLTPDASHNSDKRKHHSQATNGRGHTSGSRRIAQLDNRYQYEQDRGVKTRSQYSSSRYSDNLNNMVDNSGYYNYSNTYYRTN